MARDIYATLGVRRRINAAGTLTRLGGALMSPEITEAMAAAARCSVDVGELQAAASRVLGRITGAEAGMVTTGASAALTLAAAACMTRWDVARMAALPQAEGFANEILLPRTHYTSYAHALRVAGARLVDLGHNDRGSGAGVRGLEAWEIEAAVSPKAAAFAFSANPATYGDLPMVVAVCHRLGLPVIVDAAAQLPPKANLRRFIDAGADLVAFSGGKAIGGPQTSGLLVGRRDLVGAALLQQLDMDVSPETWTPPELVERAALKGVPHHGLGRGFKAGKEEIVGLLVALERFAAADDAAANAASEERLRRIGAAIGELPGVGQRLVPARDTGRVAWLQLAVDASVARVDAMGLSRRLQDAPVPVHLSERFAAQGILTIDVQALAPEDDARVAAAVREAVLAAPGTLRD